MHLLRRKGKCNGRRQEKKNLEVLRRKCKSLREYVGEKKDRKREWQRMRREQTKHERARVHVCMCYGK